MNPRTASCRLPSGALLLLIRLAQSDPQRLAAQQTCCLRIPCTDAGDLLVLIDARPGPDADLEADARGLAAAIEAGELAVDPGVALPWSQP